MAQTRPLPRRCRELLTEWRLESFAETFAQQDLIEIELWPKLSIRDLCDIGMTTGNALRFVSKAANLATSESERVMESTWTAMVTREDVQPLKEELDIAEAGLRRANVRKMMECDETSQEFQDFWEQSDSLAETIQDLRAVFENEVQSCGDDDYFKQLVIFARYTTQNQKYNNVLMTYGLQQHQEILSNREEWEELMDEIEADSERVKDEFKEQEQPIMDIIRMYPRAVVTQNRLRLLLKDLGAGMDEGRVYIESGFKSLYRIIEKMAFHKERQWSPDIWDMSRGMISFDSLRKIVDALKKLEGNAEIEVINIWNRFKRDKTSAWQDVTVHIRFLCQSEDVRMISEIQLCLQHLTVARMLLGGHDEYMKYRSAAEVVRFVDQDGVREDAIEW